MNLLYWPRGNSGAAGPSNPLLQNFWRPGNDPSIPTLRLETPAAAGVTGTLAASEAGDTAALAGQVIVQGTLAASEAGDTAAFAGQVIVQGALAASESGDTFAATGTVSAAPIVGTLDASEASDTFEATGTAAGAITGTLAASESPDSVLAYGTAVPYVEPGDVVPGVFYPDGRPARALDLRRDVIYPPREPRESPSAPAAARSALRTRSLQTPEQQPGLL